MGKEGVYAYVCVYIYRNRYFLHISGVKHFLNDYPKANFLLCLLKQNNPSNISHSFLTAVVEITLQIVFLAYWVAGESLSLPCSELEFRSSDLLMTGDICKREEKKSRKVKRCQTMGPTHVHRKPTRFRNKERIHLIWKRMSISHKMLTPMWLQTRKQYPAL